MSREQFICDNLGLVHTCARRFMGRGLEYDDLYQAGCLGLVKAVDGFQPERGLCFSTYAVPVILGEIRHLFREGGAVKVSRSLKELSLRVSHTRDRLATESGREPSVEDLAQALDIEPGLIAQALQVALPPLSLTGGDEGEEHQWDLPTPSPEEQVTDRLVVRQLLDGLGDRDRQLIELRYIRHQTQQATANRLGMSQVQVSRRERALLAHMRKDPIG